MTCPVGVSYAYTDGRRTTEWCSLPEDHELSHTTEDGIFSWGSFPTQAPISYPDAPIMVTR